MVRSLIRNYSKIKTYSCAKRNFVMFFSAKYTLPSVGLKTWIRNSALIYMGIIMFVGYAGKKKKEWINQNSSNYDLMPIDKKVMVLGEIIELSKIAPYVVICNKYFIEILDTAMKDENIDLSLKCNIVDAINSLSTITDISKTISVENLKSLFARHFEQTQQFLGKSGITLKNTNLSKDIAEAINLTTKLAQFLKQHLISAADPYHKQNTDKNQNLADFFAHLPIPSQKFLRLFRNDYFADDAIKAEFYERSKLSLFYGFLWGFSRALIHNPRYLKKSLSSSLFRSSLVGALAGLCGVSSYLFYSFFDDSALKEQTAFLSKKLCAGGVSPFLISPLAELPLFGATSAFMFLCNRVVSPFGNVPFLISFFYLSPLKARLANAV